MGSQAADPPGGGSLRDGARSQLFAPSERERLVAAMAASCAEVGYAATEVEAVVAEAGLSRDSFAEHFGDKEACALAAVNQTLAEVTTAVMSAYSLRYSEWEVVIRAVRALLELLAARPSQARLACIEARQTMPDSAFELYMTGIRVLVALLDRLREGAAGADVPRPASATRAAVGGAEALIRRELEAGRAERLPRLLPAVIYGLSVPYLDQQEALRYAGLARELLNDGG